MKRHCLFLVFVLIFTVTLAGCREAERSDGTYTVQVTLTGGSGRASIASPAQVDITNGQATATIIWSSPFYEYMLLGETRYDPIQEEGNATFKIPIVLDEDMPVSASTIAMSQPHLVDYTLHFHSNTLKGA